MGNTLCFDNLNGISFVFPDRLRLFPNCALLVYAQGISQQDTRRDVCAWDPFALDENVSVAALRSLKNFLSKCGSEYFIL